MPVSLQPAVIGKINGSLGFDGPESLLSPMTRRKPFCQIIGGDGEGVCIAAGHKNLALTFRKVLDGIATRGRDYHAESRHVFSPSPLLLRGEGFGVRGPMRPIGQVRPLGASLSPHPCPSPLSTGGEGSEREYCAPKSCRVGVLAHHLSARGGRVPPTLHKSEG